MCAFVDGTCVIDEEGNVFWTTRPDVSCNFNHYDVLYEGLATKIEMINHTEMYPDIYTITTQDITFTLEKRVEHHAATRFSGANSQGYIF